VATLAFGQIIRPGVFPILPGGYLRLTSSVPTPSTVRGVVALVGRASWGPLNVPQLCYGVDDTTRYFGASSTINSLMAQALAGGAQAAYCVRAGGTGGAAATLILSTVAPVTPSVQLTAKNPGAMAMQVSLRQSPALPGTYEFVTFYGGLPLETKNIGATHTAGDLMNALNASVGGSVYFSAAYSGSGAAGDNLGLVTQVPVSGGSDPVVTAAGMDAARQMLLSYPWFALCEDSEDPVEHVALQGFIDQAIMQGLRRMAVAGQNINTVSVQQAAPTVAAINDPAMVYVANDFQTANGAVAGANFAARVAGIISTMRPTHTMTGRAIPDATAIPHDLSRSDSAYAQQAGMIYATHDHRGRVVTSKGVTSVVNVGIPPLWAENIDPAWKMVDRSVRVFTIVDDLMQTLLDRIMDPDPDARPLQNQVGLLDLLATGQRCLAAYMPAALDPSSKLVLDQTVQNAAPAGTYAFKIDPFMDVGGVDTIIIKLNTSQ
jgi:hypothetical protein